MAGSGAGPGTTWRHAALGSDRREDIHAFHYPLPFSPPSIPLPFSFSSLLCHLGMPGARVLLPFSLYLVMPCVFPSLHFDPSILHTAACTTWLLVVGLVCAAHMLCFVRHFSAHQQTSLPLAMPLRIYAASPTAMRATARCSARLRAICSGRACIVALPPVC